MFNKKSLSILGLLFGVILISGCIGQPIAPTEEVQPTGELKEFTVEGSEYMYSPASITVNKGDRVKVTFKNIGNIGHNFVIGDLGVSTRVIPSGSTDVVEFTADRTGTFAFYCSVSGHRPAGMEGQIIIS